MANAPELSGARIHLHPRDCGPKPARQAVAGPRCGPGERSGLGFRLCAPATIVLGSSLRRHPPARRLFCRGAHDRQPACRAAHRRPACEAVRGIRAHAPDPARRGRARTEDADRRSSLRRGPARHGRPLQARVPGRGGSDRRPSLGRPCRESAQPVPAGVGNAQGPARLVRRPRSRGGRLSSGPRPAPLPQPPGTPGASGSCRDLGAASCRARS